MVGLPAAPFCLLEYIAAASFYGLVMAGTNGLSSVTRWCPAFSVCRCKMDDMVGRLVIALVFFPSAFFVPRMEGEAGRPFRDTPQEISTADSSHSGAKALLLVNVDRLLTSGIVDCKTFRSLNRTREIFIVFMS